MTPNDNVRFVIVTTKEEAKFIQTSYKQIGDLDGKIIPDANIDTIFNNYKYDEEHPCIIEIDIKKHRWIGFCDKEYYNKRNMENLYISLIDALMYAEGIKSVPKGPVKFTINGHRRGFAEQSTYDCEIDMDNQVLSIGCQSITFEEAEIIEDCWRQLSQIEYPLFINTKGDMGTNANEYISMCEATKAFACLNKCNNNEDNEK